MCDDKEKQKIFQQKDTSALFVYTALKHQYSEKKKSKREMLLCPLILASIYSNIHIMAYCLFWQDIIFDQILEVSSFEFYVCLKYIHKNQMRQNKLVKY